MAKKTKDSNLSLEERLEQALIPNWDEPYKLPENWCWVKLDNITNITSGGTPSRGKPLYWQNGNIPWVKISDISGKYVETTEEKITQLGLDNSSAKIFKKGTILYSIFATIGDVAILNVDAATNQAIAGITCSPSCNIDYLYYVLLVLKDLLVAKAKGVAQVNINQSILKETPIPFAPFEEQQRIVESIESLFSKLDEAKEKAQEVVDGFETRKAAILHKAFSGELTAKWREENDADRGNYAKRRFDEVAIIKSNLVDPAEYQIYPHIAPDNIEKKTGVLLEYHTIAEDGVKSGKHRFYSGQILYSKIRPNLSKVVVVDFDGLCSADMYPIEAIGDAKCLWYFMLSENFLEQASSAGSRSVLPKINQKELSALTVTIPDSLEEQKEIANIIDSLFAKEYQVKETAEAVIEQIATMKKAILSRAFRGELGTNDPSEESAVELLKNVLLGNTNQQEPTKPDKKSPSIPNHIETALLTKLEKKIISLFYTTESKVVSVDEIMSVSSKKIDIIDTLTKLEQRGILIRLNNSCYRIKE